VPEGACELLLDGERLLLHPSRAVLWPAAGMAVVADVHLGKEGVFAAHGMAVPRGPSADDLARLGELVDAHACTRLLVLGDLFHGASGVDDALLDALSAWRAARPRVRLLAIAGNHDRPSLRARSAGLVEWCEDDLREGGFAFRHEPGVAEDAFVLAGHVHPAYRLGAAGRDRMRLPVFWQRPGCLVLPAFGRFTGGWNLRPAPEDRLYAVGPGAVIPVRSAGPAE
jgi:DNA ligase-associated metallophosphoesterase